MSFFRTWQIVDVDNMTAQPKGLTSASGIIDVMTHAIEHMYLL